jgi:hypothetical protein
MCRRDDIWLTPRRLLSIIILLKFFFVSSNPDTLLRFMPFDTIAFEEPPHFPLGSAI